MNRVSAIHGTQGHLNRVNDSHGWYTIAEIATIS